MLFPRLPAKAAYVTLNNPGKRNALSLSVLRDLRSQLHGHLTSPHTGNLLLLPPFKPSLLKDFESSVPEIRWLLDADEWRKLRNGLPNVLVLRSEGPVFSSGHDLKELSQLSAAEVRETFDLCAEVMSLIRRSPAPVVCAVQGLATAAGFQLVMTADFPIALARTKFCLPGMRIGLPCTSPATAVSRRLPTALAYRLFATGETITADQLHGAVDVVPVPEHAESTDTAIAAFEARVDAVVTRLAEETAGQPAAFGKWSYWTQLAINEQRERTSGGDAFEGAARWAGRVMALLTGTADAKEGIHAFKHKKQAVWQT